MSQPAAAINVAASNVIKPDLLAGASISGVGGAASQKQKGKRIFISSANSLLGHSLFDELRNDHIAIQRDATEESHKFFASLNPKEAATVPLPSSTIRVLNHRTKPKMFKKKLPTCDWLIMDMLSAALSGTLDEVELVVRTIKDLHANPTAQTKDQTIVLISSVITWSQT
jgi:hypothetical protein